MQSSSILEPSDIWKTTFPGAYVGVLVMNGVLNPAHHPGLEKRKVELEAEIRTRFVGQDRSAMLQHPILHIYERYYRRFKKTYHIQLQPLKRIDSLQRQIYSERCGSG
jgi:hypothetical protein